MKNDLTKLYEEIKKPIVDKYKEVREEFVTKLKPVVKHLTPIIKDIEVSVKCLIKLNVKKINFNGDTNYLTFSGDHSCSDTREEEGNQEKLITK